MTEDQHIALVKAGDKFWVKFSQLIAEALDSLPADMDETEALYYLQDHTSVFGSEYSKHRRQKPTK